MIYGQYYPDLAHHQDEALTRVETYLWAVLPHHQDEALTRVETAILQDLAHHQDEALTRVETDLWAVLPILQDLAHHQDEAHTLPHLRTPQNLAQHHRVRSVLILIVLVIYYSDPQKMYWREFI